MKNITDEQFEQDFTIISNMKEVGAPDFFYTRLKARMESESTSNEAVFYIKPILVICVLSLFLFINSLLIGNDTQIVRTNTNTNIEALAVSYDQTISN